MLDSGNKYSRAIKNVNWLYLGYSIVGIFIVKYTFLYWVTFIIGIGCCSGIFLYWIFMFQGPLVSRRKPSHKKFTFLAENEWEDLVSQFQINQDGLNEPIVESSFLISETFDDFIDLIVQEFIDGWYSKISKDEAFPVSIKLELKSVFRKLVSRVEEIDIPKLLVSRIIPIFNEHIQQYNRAEEMVRIKPSSTNSHYDSPQYNMAIVRNYYKGKLHPAVTMNLNLAEDMNEKKYLRKKMSAVLPILLSDSEAKNEIGISLVTEILACTILANVFKMLAESDFYNLLVVKLIGDNLKHRNQVKQLRAALEQHTQSVNKKNQIKDDETSAAILSGVKRNIISAENTTSNSFKVAIDDINNIQSKEELQSLKRFFIHKLKDADQSLSGSSTNKFQVTVNNIDDKLVSFGDTKETASSSIELSDVLNNDVALQEFLKFMKDKSKQSKYIMWNAIESIKAPLEDVAMDDNDNEEDKLHLSLEFSNTEDIRLISRLVEEETDLPPENELKNALQRFIESRDFERLDMIQEIRQLLFKYQGEIYASMKDDFVSFMMSDSFEHLVSIGAFLETNNEVKEAAGKVQDYRKEELIKEPADSISPGVVKAVEDAFTEIMKSSQDNITGTEKLSRRATLSSLHSSSSESDLLEQSYSNSFGKKDLFGDNTSLFGESSFNSNENSQNYKSTKLFDDASEDSETDSESVIMDSDSQYLLSLEENRLEDSDSQIFLAAPGNLSLSEEIAKIDDEIDKLNEQLAILEPLIKKAELTDNINELKILKKSKTSLNREISSKELQKQQYIVQENDNSLYGKSKVQIQSYISGSENNKEFIVYIVEVQKLSDDDVVTAGWIVARRFSQFFKLHEYLKARYPKVNNIKFPKRTVSVLKFQQKSLVELRKKALEEYLQQVIQIPEVCSSRAFRSFLSSENFNISKNEPFDENVRTQSNSYKNNVEFVASKLYRGISNKLIQNNPSPMYEAALHSDVVDNLKDMQKELRQFDDVNNLNSKPIFVKPICDILITVFRLNSNKSWLRGRALLVILQQIFGTTIEKKVYEFVDTNLRTEEKALDLLIQVKNGIFPNGKFKDPPVERSIFELTSTRNEARALLNTFMNETCSKIFGLSNTNFAFSKIFGVLQNEILNKHLIFEIFDQLLFEIFPELEASDSVREAKY